MNQLARLEERVTRLEGRVDDVHDLARGTDQEVSGWRGVLNNHTQALNAMGEKIDLFQKRVDARFDEVDDRFDEVDDRFDKLEAKVDDKFELLRQGQEKITGLLTRHLGETDEETHTGHADE